MKTKEELNRLTKIVLDASIAVHKEMGPGLLESVYQYCLADELAARKINVNVLVHVPLVYKGKYLNKDFIIDILVEDEIIIELKATEVTLPVHEAQIISYLKLTNRRLGLLINFNTPRLIDGYQRFVNKL